MYKILVSDFYDTLINKDEAISISTMLDIDRMRNNKSLFVVATSSLFRGILDYNMSYVFSDYIISYNGAHVYNTVKDRVIFKKNIGLTALKKIAKFDVDNIAFYTLNSIFYTAKVLDSNYGVKVNDIDDFIDFHKSDVYEMVLYDTKSNLDDIMKQLDKINVNYYLRSKGKKYFIEIVGNGINKFNDCKIVLEKEGIKVSELVSIGCSSNDFELVSSSGVGVCIKNGEDSIKKIADYVTKKSNTNGVKEVIDKYFGEIDENSSKKRR